MRGLGPIVRLARRLRPRPARPLILMYHRVAALRVDPWELAVRPDRFAEQLDVLRRTRVPLAAYLREAVDMLLAKYGVKVKKPHPRR